MITEDYVSFETAKLLKEKGFEGDISCYYTQDNSKRWGYQHYHDFDKKDKIECPTLQMAMKWLREVHNTQIEISIVGVETWENPSKWFYGFRCQNKDIIDRHTADFECYEEALDAAIKYCLENLI